VPFGSLLIQDNFSIQFILNLAISSNLEPQKTGILDISNLEHVIVWSFSLKERR
jgi:hypothetical protein